MMNRVKQQSGIVSYGAYIPRFRIKVEEIASVYGKDPQTIKKGLGLNEKSVPSKDEDTITIAVNASRQLMSRVKSVPAVGAIYTGSESHPYAVKSSSSIIGEALGISPNFTAADIEFACKAGTASIQMVMGLVESGRIQTGLAIGSDCAQGAPGDALEYSAGSAAAAFLIGKKDLIAKIIHTTSFTTDTPDFWRREHQKYPSHGGRFTGEPAYFTHLISATKNLLEDTSTKIKDFDHVVFHMPNGKFPQVAAKMLGVKPDQMKYGFVVPNLGNSYSACSLIGLVNVLDNAKPGEKILLTSYGSGAGADSFAFEVTKNIVEFRKSITNKGINKSLQFMIENKSYLNYGQYINYTRKI